MTRPPKRSPEQLPLPGCCTSVVATTYFDLAIERARESLRAAEQFDAAAHTADSASTVTAARKYLAQLEIIKERAEWNR